MCSTKSSIVCTQPHGFARKKVGIWPWIQWFYHHLPFAANLQYLPALEPRHWGGFREGAAGGTGLIGLSSSSWGYLQMDGIEVQFPSRNGWWLGVPLFMEPPPKRPFWWISEALSHLRSSYKKNMPYIIHLLRHTFHPSDPMISMSWWKTDDRTKNPWNRSRMFEKMCLCYRGKVITAVRSIRCISFSNIQFVPKSRKFTSWSWLLFQRSRTRSEWYAPAMAGRQPGWWIIAGKAAPSVASKRFRALQKGHLSKIAKVLLLKSMGSCFEEDIHGRDILWGPS